MAKSIAIYFSPDGQQMPDLVAAWLSGLGLQVETLRDPDDLMAMSLRGRPRAVVMDARAEPGPSLTVIHRMKSDSYTAVVPCLLLSADDDASFALAFEAGADEFLLKPIPLKELLAAYNLDMSDIEELGEDSGGVRKQEMLDGGQHDWEQALWRAVAELTDEPLDFTRQLGSPLYAA